MKSRVDEENLQEEMLEQWKDRKHEGKEMGSRTELLIRDQFQKASPDGICLYGIFLNAVHDGICLGGIFLNACPRRPHLVPSIF
jgi:hypothetical protein